MRIKPKLILIGLTILMLSLLAGCKDPISSSNTIATAEIEDILSNITKDFNHLEIEAIRQYYDDDFLHDGDNVNMAMTDWGVRATDYTNLRFDNISISIDGELATASFTMRLDRVGTVITESFHEPEDGGELSYFHSAYGEWLLWGNQEFGRSR
ncbi:MAG: hypothetical protein K8S56_10835 [Candidatus Cloacimonetes bacterium]|nr:hypothetical protein [Candidatus Cloacimonadota bacterium]